MCRKIQNGFGKFVLAGILFWGGFFDVIGVQAKADSFTNLLARADQAERKNDFASALKIYAQARASASNNAADLCVLARQFCDLMYLTNSPAVKKELLDQANQCSQAAILVDPSNATAHASLAVCYAKDCSLAGTKDALKFSRLFKAEAEQAIKLDPKQDVAYYLLGRWNYGVANIGLFSRTYVKLVYGGLPEASNKEAIKDFKKAIELAPNRIIHHAGLAVVYEATGQTKLEIKELETCCALKPTDREDLEAQANAEKELAKLRK